MNNKELIELKDYDHWETPISMDGMSQLVESDPNQITVIRLKEIASNIASEYYKNSDTRYYELVQGIEEDMLEFLPIIVYNNVANYINSKYAEGDFTDGEMQAIYAKMDNIATAFEATETAKLQDARDEIEAFIQNLVSDKMRKAIENVMDNTGYDDFTEQDYARIAETADQVIQKLDADAIRKIAVITAMAILSYDGKLDSELDYDTVADMQDGFIANL